MLAALRRVLEQHPGRTVVVVSHVTPIKTLVANTLERAAGRGVPDGAEPGLGQGASRSTRPVGARRAGTPRCGSTTRCRRGIGPCSTPVAGDLEIAAVDESYRLGTLGVWARDPTVDGQLAIDGQGLGGHPPGTRTSAAS